MRKLRVAIVAASLDIPGGQSVQADRLVRAWRGDPELEAWLVPVHWALPRRLRWAARIKGVPSFVMETRYLPRLVPGLARADVVHVFAAAYLPFLLAPLPALIVARALGRPVILNYRNGEAPDHLRQSAIARAAMRAADSLVVPSEYLVNVLAGFGFQATAIANIIDLERFRFRDRQALTPRVL